MVGGTIVHPAATPELRLMVSPTYAALRYEGGVTRSLKTVSMRKRVFLKIPVREKRKQNSLGS